MKKKINIETFFFVSIIVVSVAFLLPLIVLSFYNHPSVDDFSYSISTMKFGKYQLCFFFVAEAFRTSAKYYIHARTLFFWLFYFRFNRVFW